MSETPAGKHFTPEMAVADAMAVHPRVGEVFAAFHLGGCAHCGISHFETIEQVCAAYGVDVNVLLEVLEDVVARESSAAGGGASGA